LEEGKRSPLTLLKGGKGKKEGKKKGLLFPEKEERGNKKKGALFF